MDFSVLISVYENDNKEHFKKALESVINQTLKPSEIVLVIDGPVDESINTVVSEFQKDYADLFKVIIIKENKGLGNALKTGLKECSYELVARMDADDISLPHRFERQVKFLEKNREIDLVGSYIAEFEEDENNIYAVRCLPSCPEKISNFAKWRSPVNHMSIMFRKNMVLDAGNYKTFLGFEDYYLWARMLNNGCKFANIDEILVNVRAGRDMIKRRAGQRYLINEIKLQLEFFKIGFIGKSKFVRNVSLKVLLRIIPSFLREFIYQKFLRKPVNSNIESQGKFLINIVNCKNEYMKKQESKVNN